MKFEVPEGEFLPGDSNSSSKDSGVITMHIMPSSHIDAGWIYTFEQYYQGTNTQDGGCVKCILENISGSLKKNTDRKYDMAEVSFFKRWWMDQDEAKKAAFKNFIKTKQFDFINGGWSANDEATTYYEDIMDNFILGHRWLKDNLDMDPSIGWHVDSFGTSSTHAALLAQAGYDGLFFSRADYIDRAKRIDEQALQFNWESQNPQHESVFTQMMYVRYSDTTFMISDNFYCRSIFCNGRLTPDQYVKVTDWVKLQSQAFKTNNVLFQICDDFLLWRGAETDYDGIEALIQYFAERPELGIKAKFSHLGDYLGQVKQDLKKMTPQPNLPVKHDDFFPYVEKKWNVWTGYFTSKSMFKLLVRQTSEYYNAVKLLLSKLLLVSNKNVLVPDMNSMKQLNNALNSIEEPLAIVQHHDAVSGTMKEYVRTDYENMLANGRKAVETTLQPILLKLLKERIGETPATTAFQYDWLYRDDSYTQVFDGTNKPTIAIFNPGSARQQLVKVKLPGAQYKIINEANNQLPTDIICNSKDSKSDCYMYFVDDFAAYSFKVYKVLAASDAKPLTPSDIDKNVDLNIEDSVFFDINKDLVNFGYKYCAKKDKCVSDSFNMDYEYYESSVDSSGGRVASGAYVFVPRSEKKIKYSSVVSGRVFKGTYMTMVQIFRKDLRTDIKILNHQLSRGIEVESYLEPVASIENGKEITLIIRSKKIGNGNTIFYTDSNGYFMEKRVKDHKDDYPLEASNGVPVNYYPMTSNVFIEDEKSKQRLSVTTDRAQGVTSLKTGEVEIMIHRVTVKDDWKGVSEPLQERDPKTRQLVRVTTRHWISYSQPSLDIVDPRREQQYDYDRPLHLWFYLSKTDNFAQFNNDQNENIINLPNLVKVTVRSYNLNEYIVRLHNMDESTETKTINVYSSATKECTLLNSIAGKSGIKIASIEELSWVTTKPKSQVAKNEFDTHQTEAKHQDGDKFSTISLLPLELRTFSIKLAP